MIIPDIANNVYAELARGVEDIATMYRYNIILANSDQHEDKELQLLDTMLGKQVDGIVMMSDEVTEKINKRWIIRQYQLCLQALWMNPKQLQL